jgi:3-hydroxyacyl-[acyl-carrier-protein] dehydratase
MRIEYFQLIDRITSIDLAEPKIHTQATIPAESTIFEGHFPGYPLMPGVLLIEAMAQTAGWLIIATTKFERMPFLIGVKEAKFRTFVQPSQALVGSATIAHEGSGYTIMDTKLALNGKAVCSAQLSFRVMPFPNPTFETEMRAAGKRLEFPMEALADG